MATVTVRDPEVAAVGLRSDLDPIAACRWSEPEASRPAPRNFGILWRCMWCWRAARWSLRSG